LHVKHFNVQAAAALDVGVSQGGRCACACARTPAALACDRLRLMVGNFNCYVLHDNDDDAELLA
jgi:hypothetical protein